MRSLTIGVFDGVHLGHTYMVKKMVNYAIAHHQIPTAIVFEMPYEAIVDPKSFEGLITTPQERVELLKKIGVVDVIVQDLREIAEMNERAYVDLLVNKYEMKSIYIGYDFKFGKRAKGDIDLLREMGKIMGFTVDVTPKIIEGGVRISSSLIRREIRAGRVDVAMHFLGRPFSISGTVFRERGIGSKIGFPTANISREGTNLVVPKYGVYLVRSTIDGSIVYGVMGIGVRPTTDTDGNVTYEVHFLDGEYKLTGKKLKVELLEFMRPEMKFKDLNELKEAIRKDVERAHELIFQKSYEQI
ncbi:riboflavin biosynthesis protein RibF [Athalassotoga saccharophila]|uniref:riboflavin biosynthesis protein RibF n=1 Tax=Athalassotoga saccharophila TaxID=1441386 RepID=UPI00137A712F|nr:riboflavin biosynthesis protein RibF [Athalassotoga saccharophila]BBJ28550.1 riboflavin biosynthesis protein RibF [Athalassotoga saccharophila]